MFALPAGQTRLDCVYFKAGDWMATNHEARGAYDSNSQDAYLVQTLQSKRGTGTPPVLSSTLPARHTKHHHFRATSRKECHHLPVVDSRANLFCCVA